MARELAAALRPVELALAGVAIETAAGATVVVAVVVEAYGSSLLRNQRGITVQSAHESY